MTSSVNGGRSSLRRLLSEFASRYPSARKEPLAGHEVASLMRREVASALESTGVFEKGLYKISGSVGKGGWAEIPWVAVYDLSETDTLHHGFFVAYVFSADMSSLFLTLDQGSVTYYDTHTRAETDIHIRGVADAVLGSMDGRGTDVGRIDLGATSSVGRFLENGCMFSVRYRLDDLPDDPKLVEDLRLFKLLYKEALDVKRSRRLRIGSFPM